MMKFVRAALLGTALLSVPLFIALHGTPAFAQKKTESSPKIIDINSASADTLKTIPGIGDAYSAAIIKGRPYKRKDELADRKIIPEATYQKIKDLIIAKQK